MIDTPEPAAGAPGQGPQDRPPLWTGATEFDSESFRQFVAMRIGTGAPVYWYGVGEVSTYPEGRRVLRIEGCDTGRVVYPEHAPDTVWQLSRKYYVFRDPVTNAVLRQYDGRPVPPIAYPYQYLSFRLDNGRVVAAVEQGAGAALVKIGPLDNFILRRLGTTLVVSTPLFLNRETPRGKYEAYENYDFILRVSETTPRERYQMTWNRFADLPAFLGPGRAMLQMVGWRVDAFEDLPSTIRECILQDAPMWKEPPKDLDEIRTLQQ
jgi:hypothetical protein